MKEGTTRNTAILASFLLISKGLGALYRVPLLKIIGAEGMGMYQLTFSIYALIISFTTGGVTSLIAKITAERVVQNATTKGVIKYFLLASMIVSVVIAGILILIRNYIARFQGNEGISSLYFYIAPAIVFVSVMTVFRGWFQGKCNVIPTSISEIIEGIFKLTIGLILSKSLINRGVFYGVMGAIIGVTVSEFLALLYVIIRYLFTKKQDDVVACEVVNNDNIKSLLTRSILFALFGFIIPFSQFIDGILIVNILKMQNESVSSATSLYGIFSGSVMSIINLPAFLTIAITTVIIPTLSRCNVKRDILGIENKTETAVKLSLTISIPLFILFALYSKQIISILYPNLSSEYKNTAIQLLEISSLSIVFTSLREILSSILISLGFIKKVFLNNILSVLLKTVTMIFLLLKIGIVGVSWALVVFQISGTLLNFSNLKFLLGKNPKLTKNISKIFISGVIISILVFIINMAGGVWTFYVGSILSVIIFGALVYFSGAFYNGEVIKRTPH